MIMKIAIVVKMLIETEGTDVTCDNRDNNDSDDRGYRGKDDCRRERKAARTTKLSTHNERKRIRAAQESRKLEPRVRRRVGDLPI